MVKIQEAENQFITDCVVYSKRPSDSILVISGIESHKQRLGRVPYLIAGDAAFYSAKNEVEAQSRGVKRVCIPNRSTQSPVRERLQKGALV